MALKYQNTNHRQRDGVIGPTLGGLLRTAVFALLLTEGTALESEWGCRGSSSSVAEIFTCADGSTVNVTDCTASASSAAELQCLVEEYTAAQTATIKEAVEVTVYLYTNVTLDVTVVVPAGAHVAVIGTTSATDGDAVPEGWPGAALPPTISLSGDNSVRLFDVIGPTLDTDDDARTYSQVGDGNTTLLLRNVILEDGWDENTGGMVYVLGANLYIDGCIVRGGKVGTPDPYLGDDARGGAVFFAFYDQKTGDHASTDSTFALDIQGSLFYDNVVEGIDYYGGSAQGGALYVSKYYDTSMSTPSAASHVVVRDSTFRNNEARDFLYIKKSGGGALYTDSSETGLVQVAMSNVTVDANQGRVGGAFHLGLGTNAELELVTFTNNLSPGAGPLTGGGGIFVSMYASVELNRVVATNNSVTVKSNFAAGPAGGGFVFASEFSEVNLYDSTCSYNSAAHHGGCITADAANLNVYRSELSHNYAGRFGSEVMVIDGKMFTYGSTYRNSNELYNGTETGYLVHGSGSELSFDSSTLEGLSGYSEGPSGAGYETHLVGSILSDVDIIVRNSEVRGPTAHYSTNDIDDATEEPYQELTAVDDKTVQSCAALSGEDSMAMEIELKCSSGYCSDSSLVGIDCYCDTLFGPRDPTWEGCDDPPAMVVLQETYSVYTHKPDVLSQTFFFKNDGEEILHWTVSPVDLPVDHGQTVRYYPTSGNLTSCTMGNITVEVPSYSVDSYTNYGVTLDLVSSAYPFKVSPDFTTLTFFNTTTRIQTNYFVAAQVNATNSFVVNGTTLGLIEESYAGSGEAFRAAAMHNVTHLRGTAGYLLEAAIVPVDEAGLWIRGSPGAEKYDATLAREDGDDEVVCQVGFDGESNTYTVQCFLDDFAAGVFHLEVNHLRPRASSTSVTGYDGYDAIRLGGSVKHSIEVNVDCATGFKQLDERVVSTTTNFDGETTSVVRSGAGAGRYTCGCTKGQYLEVSNAECKACKTGKFGPSSATIYKPDVCISCARLFEGPVVTVEEEATSVDQCICSPSHYKSQHLHNVTDALINFDIMGECETCPEGTECPDYGHEVEDWVVDPGYWRAANSSLNVYGCRENPADNWKSSCVGSLGNISGKYTLCGDGYDGPLCSKCAFDYYRDISGFCYHCKGVDSQALINWTVFMLFCFFIVGPLAIMFAFNQKNKIKDAHEKKLKLDEERRDALVRLKVFSRGGFTSMATGQGGQLSLSKKGVDFDNETATAYDSFLNNRQQRTDARLTMLTEVKGGEELDEAAKKRLEEMDAEEKVEQDLVKRAMEVTETLTDRELAIEMVRYEIKLALHKQDELFGVEEEKQRKSKEAKLRKIRMLAKKTGGFSARLARNAQQMHDEEHKKTQLAVAAFDSFGAPKPKLGAAAAAFSPKKPKKPKLRATAVVAPMDGDSSDKPVLKAKAVAFSSKSNRVAPAPVAEAEATAKKKKGAEEKGAESAAPGLQVKNAKRAADTAAAAGMVSTIAAPDASATGAAVSAAEDTIVVNLDDLMRDAMDMFGDIDAFRKLGEDIRKMFSSIMKSISNELQLTSKFSLSVDVKLPTVSRSLMGVMNLVNLDIASMLPMECFSGWTYNYHTKVVLNTVFPMITLGFIYLLYMVCARSKIYYDLKEKWFMIGLLFMHFNYANLCNLIFTLFACEDYDYGDDGFVSLLQVDLTIMCMSERHRAMQMYGIVALFIFPIGVPMMYLSIMNHHRARMDYTYYRSNTPNGSRLSDQELYDLRATDPNTRAFGFLYSQYNSSNYWFEVMECFRKMVLCGLVVLLAPGTPTQYTMSMLVFFILFTFIAYFKPYQSELDAQIALVCYVTTFITYVVTFLISYEVDSAAQLSNFAVTGLLCIATTLPLLFGLWSFHGATAEQYAAYRQKVNLFNKSIDTRVKQIVEKRDDLKLVAGSAATKWMKKIGLTPLDKTLPTRRKAYKEKLEKLHKQAAKGGEHHGLNSPLSLVPGEIGHLASGLASGLSHLGHDLIDGVGHLAHHSHKGVFDQGSSFVQMVQGTKALANQESNGFGRADGSGEVDSEARRAATVTKATFTGDSGDAATDPPMLLRGDSSNSVNTQELHGELMLDVEPGTPLDTEELDVGGDSLDTEALPPTSTSSVSSSTFL